jgi:hypothetical protein
MQRLRGQWYLQAREKKKTSAKIAGVAVFSRTVGQEANANTAGMAVFARTVGQEANANTAGMAVFARTAGNLLQRLWREARKAHVIS